MDLKAQRTPEGRYILVYAKNFIRYHLLAMDLRAFYFGR
jgi:hypothetical protein